ncbi:inositol monophosphatase family protein [uncultured Duncaniella sp.]|uniref:inositol monophosphatase family protein n=1 Tax=uncultured Duncaniella sp. TaxID=2768039 RepID=UPI00260C1A2D|nr:inositol monophosphatase family protein [uncultured Duncaniella sp.]
MNRTNTLQPELAEVIACVKQAGKIAMQYFRSGHKIEMHNKLNDSDIVTIADKECETCIKDFIRKNYPEHSILSEESGETCGDAQYRWVIDPIDGTTNFYSGIPLWGISIGVEFGGVTELGVVYLPATDELFYAQRGQGAYLNGRRIHVAPETKLSRAVISTGFPVDKNVNPDNNLDNLAAILPLVRDIRRLGAATADICYVAAGFLSGYWELNLHEWDVNAALLILSEAGGKSTRFREDRGISILCANPSIHDQLLPYLNPAPRDEAIN